MTKPKTSDQTLSTLQFTHDKTLVELEHYKLLVESVQDYAIFLLDPQGYIITWNKGAERNKGYKAHEIIGQHFSKFYQQHDIDAKKPERELKLAKQYGRIEDEDWRVRKDGTRFWANVIITALIDETGTLVGFAKVTRDLTERKRQEDELRQANTLLRKQQRELQALNAAKDEFISLASHQLRTPATAVKQLLAMLKEGFYGEIPETHQPIIDKAYASNERQIAIVNSLLQVAQLDAGKVVLRKSLTDMNKMLPDIIEEQKDTLESRRQTITYEGPKDNPHVNVDPKYIRMALENLIDNASKYTYDYGTISVTSTVESGQLSIEIKDSGVGIASDDLATLFGKFKRIPNEFSQKVTGSGLGLYWVQEVVALHGGTIHVISELKKGTTFTVKLPLEKSHA
ncbi:MAG: sensor histidine kinase [Candidatus Saccharibacteria bacterium]|nr:sensor histidine kinase [Candidatus Saccharibacteria bacterium]